MSASPWVFLDFHSAIYIIYMEQFSFRLNAWAGTADRQNGAHKVPQSAPGCELHPDRAAPPSPPRGPPPPPPFHRNKKGAGVWGIFRHWVRPKTAVSFFVARKRENSNVAHGVDNWVELKIGRVFHGCGEGGLWRDCPLLSDNYSC